MNHREACRKAHQTPNPASAADAMRTRFGRFALALIKFRYLFGPKSQRRIYRLGTNAPIIPSPIIIIAATSLNRLPTIKSFRYSSSCFVKTKTQDRKPSHALTSRPYIRIMSGGDEIAANIAPRRYGYIAAAVKIRLAGAFCRYDAARIKDSSTRRERAHGRRFPSSFYTMVGNTGEV
jgi:hypothetical protein